MRAAIILLLLAFGAATLAGPLSDPGRIVGGTETTINQYPYASAVLVAHNLVNFVQNCGGTIINNRSILTAAHCLTRRTIQVVQFRVGSTFGNSGGVVHAITQMILYPDYDELISMIEHDIGLLRSATTIVYNDVVQFTGIAGPNSVIPDNTAVWAIGWGRTSTNGPTSEVLRHVEVRTINQQECVNRWGGFISPNMLCTGWLDVGGRGQCQMDSGGPVLFNNVVIGITSFTSMNCGDAFFPSGNTRVSQYTSWIQANA